MSTTPMQRYREQHAEILLLVERMQEILPKLCEPSAQGECRLLLLILKGKLGVHLSLEDRYLYPRLVRHEHPRLRETAIAFMKEMGGLRAAAERWACSWTPPDAIVQDPARFRRETETLFASLKLRIQREETQLYPMVDEAGWSALTGVA